MARAREEVIFGAAIDTTAFTRQANQMRQTAQQAGAAVSGTGAAFQQTQAKVISLGDKLKNFEPTVGKAASGVSGMAGAMGGLVGQTNAVSGAVAGLAGAFAGGGLLAVGIGAITLLVGGLAEEWGRARDEADKAREAQEDYAKTLSQLLESEIERLKDSTFELETGQKSFNRQIKEAKQEYEELKPTVNAYFAEMARLHDRQERMLLTDTEAGEMRRQLTEENQALLNRYEELSLAVADIDALQEQLTKETIRNTAAKKANEEQTKKLAKAESGRAKGLKEAAAAERDYEKEVWEQLQKEEAQEILERSYPGPLAEPEGGFDKLLKDHEDALNADAAQKAAAGEKSAALADKLRQEQLQKEKQRLEDLENAEKESQQRRIDSLRLYTGEATAAIDGAFNMSLDILERVVAGEKVMLHEMLLLFAAQQTKQAGIRIFSSGLATFIDGLLMSSVVPGSGSQAISQGAAAMAIGGSMGAAGAVGGGALGRLGIGGAAGGAGPAMQPGGIPAPEQGVNAGAGAGSRGDSAGGAVANTYVFNAPIYQNEIETANNTARLQRIARDDLLQG